MRTTIRMKPGLYKKAKDLARRENTSFTAIVEQAMVALLDTRARNRANRKKVVLPTFRGDGVRPGVDLMDYSACLDRMDEDLPLERRR